MYRKGEINPIDISAFTKDDKDSVKLNTFSKLLIGVSSNFIGADEIGNSTLDEPEIYTSETLENKPTELKFDNQESVINDAEHASVKSIQDLASVVDQPTEIQEIDHPREEFVKKNAISTSTNDTARILYEQKVRQEAAEQKRRELVMTEKWKKDLRGDAYRTDVPLHLRPNPSFQDISNSAITSNGPRQELLNFHIQNRLPSPFYEEKLDVGGFICTDLSNLSPKTKATMWVQERPRFDDRPKFLSDIPTGAGGKDLQNIPPHFHKDIHSKLKRTTNANVIYGLATTLRAKYSSRIKLYIHKFDYHPGQALILYKNDVSTNNQRNRSNALATRFNNLPLDPEITDLNTIMDRAVCIMVPSPDHHEYNTELLRMDIFLKESFESKPRENLIYKLKNPNPQNEEELREEARELISRSATVPQTCTISDEMIKELEELAEKKKDKELYSKLIKYYQNQHMFSVDVTDSWRRVNLIENVYRLTSRVSDKSQKNDDAILGRYRVDLISSLYNGRQPFAIETYPDGHLYQQTALNIASDYVTPLILEIFENSTDQRMKSLYAGNIPGISQQQFNEIKNGLALHFVKFFMESSQRSVNKKLERMNQDLLKSFRRWISRLKLGHFESKADYSETPVNIRDIITIFSEDKDTRVNIPVFQVILNPNASVTASSMAPKAKKYSTIDLVNRPTAILILTYSHDGKNVQSYLPNHLKPHVDILKNITKLTSGTYPLLGRGKIEDNVRNPDIINLFQRAKLINKLHRDAS